jgi:hypothetical protein
LVHAALRSFVLDLDPHQEVNCSQLQVDPTTPARWLLRQDLDFVTNVLLVAGARGCDDRGGQAGDATQDGGCCVRQQIFAWPSGVMVRMPLKKLADERHASETVQAIGARLAAATSGWGVDFVRSAPPFPVSDRAHTWPSAHGL